MFSFFIKKEYLVDHLKGFIDIHNHILPGIDDGAKDVEESLQLIKEFSEFGVSKFICTPHIMHNYYENTPNSIRKSFKKLKSTLNERKIENIDIDYSAEYMIDDNFENILDNKQVLTLRDKYLLIEMSYIQPSINFDISIRKITQQQIFPVFAHPERYIYLHKELVQYDEFKKKGVLFQLNMLSLSNYYGKEINNIALKLLNENKYDFIASDIHNLKHINYLKDNVILERKSLNKVLGLINNTIENFY